MRGKCPRVSIPQARLLCRAGHVSPFSEGVRKGKGVRGRAEAALAPEFHRARCGEEAQDAERHVEDYAAEGDIDSVFLMSKVANSFISSSSILELYRNGIDVSNLVPAPVLKRLKNLK